MERQEQLRTQRLASSPKIGSIREFCPKTESEKLSSDSEFNKRRTKYDRIEPKDIKEFKLDSSNSRSLIGDGFLLKDTGILDELNFDVFDIGDKTPNKRGLDENKDNKDLQNIKLLENQVLKKGFSVSKTPIKSKDSNNIKNFDDFKHLLKDLKMTLKKSDFSDFHDDFNENIQELEETMNNYNQLDEQIEKLLESQEKKGDLSNSTFYKKPGALLQNKKGSSVNFGVQEKNKYVLKLEDLQRESNINQYQDKLKKLRDDPLDFDSFLLKIKREYKERNKKFSELKEFLV